MNKSMRKITYYENILEFKENRKEKLHLNEINNWQLCRTCLMETNENDVDLEKISVMDVMQGTFLSIKEMLIQTTNISMSTSEKLPVKVCKNCFNKITAFYYFSIQVRQAEKVLIRLANKLKGHKDQLETDKAEEANNFSENELPDDIILIEVEELFDLENVEGVANTLKEMDKICTVEFKSDPEEIAESTEGLEYFEDISQIEESPLTEEGINTDFKNSEEENHFETDVLESTEASESVKEEKPVKKIKRSKKRVRKVTPTLKYKHKQPRVTSPLLDGITCEVCENTFERQQDLVNHVKDEHPNSKAYKCRVCEKLFSHIQSLSRHMNTHKESLVLNECEHCTKSFIRVDDLKRHLRVHTGERPYICSQCEKSFTQLTDLKIHEEKHHQEKQVSKVYECSQCEQTYTSRNGLYLHKRKKHDKQDMDECPYICLLCDKFFKLQSELRYHEKYHILPEMFKCDQCNHTCTSRIGLNLHNKKHHEQVNNESGKENVKKESGEENCVDDEKKC